MRGVRRRRRPRGPLRARVLKTVIIRAARAPPLVLRAELHCHNSFSNFHVGCREPPYDCGVGVREQLEAARAAGIDAVFVTNHNTLDGYGQMLECARGHEKFSGISVFPAEEITIDTGAHVLAYGLREPVRPGMSLDETLEQIRGQDGVSSAPHPFSILDALRERAAECDMIEVFNSNNVDLASNARAAEFAAERGMTAVAGSDSHVLSTMGRCVNEIDSGGSLDGALSAMRRGRVGVARTGYAARAETMEHMRYKIGRSQEYLSEYIKSEYPRSRWLLSLLLRAYSSAPDSRLWDLVYEVAVRLARRLSRGMNCGRLDASPVAERRLDGMLRMAVAGG